MKKINLILISIALLCVACGSDDNGNSQPENQPPSAIVLEFPANNTQSVDKNISFVYDVPDGDPDGDTIIYDVYLDNGTEELKIAENHTQESFTYNMPLCLNRDYTWRVMAKDNNGGETESETFSFKTRKATYESSTADYTPRWFHTALLFNDNFVIMGGRNADGLATQSRQSTDGINWSAAPSNFPDRRSHSSVVFDDKIFIFGGRDDDIIATTLSDVYELDGLSNGNTWNLVTNDYGLGLRFSSTLIVLNNKMYAIGGYESNAGGVTRYEEVISSTNGETWQIETAQAQFGPRSAHASVVFDDKMWVIAGTDGIKKNDVWYSDNGIDWTMATEHASFTERDNHSSVVYDNKIWVYGGSSEAGDELGDLWYSEDGVTWHEAKFEADGTGVLPVGLRNPSLIVKGDSMYVIGGSDNTGTLIDYTIKIQ